MPRGDGTGPPGGGGPGTGRGMGRSGGRGRIGGTRRPGVGLGPCGECVCPICGNTVSHQVGLPCYQMVCQKCGTSMVRK